MPDPIIHQVTEIPEVKTTTTEHCSFGERCRCGTITYAALPDGVPASSFGVHIVTLVGLLTGGYRLSKRTTLQFVQDVFGVPMSLGSVVACQDAVSATLEAPVDEVRDFAQEQAVASGDEASWRERRQKAWLWVLTTPLVAVFLIHANRGAVGMHSLLGKFNGILGSDRWSAYNEWPIRRRQLCWAHVIRDFTWISEREGEAERIGKSLLEETKLLFGWWYRVRDGTLKRSSFHVYVSSLRRRVETLLEEGPHCGDVKGADLAKAKVTTIQERIFKIGTRVVESVRRIVLHLPKAHPWRTD